MTGIPATATVTTGHIGTGDIGTYSDQCGTEDGGARGTDTGDGMTPGITDGAGASASHGIHGSVHGADGTDRDGGAGMIPGTGAIL